MQWLKRLFVSQGGLVKNAPCLRDDHIPAVLKPGQQFVKAPDGTWVPVYPGESFTRDDEPETLGIGFVEQQEQIFRDNLKVVYAQMGIDYDQLSADYERANGGGSAAYIKIQLEWAAESLKRKYPHLRHDPRLDGLT